MFDLDPLGRPVAILQILILLSVAAFLGWLIGRLVRASQVEAKRQRLSGQQQALDDCRKMAIRSPETPMQTPTIPTPVVVETPIETGIPVAVSEPVADALSVQTSTPIDDAQEEVFARVAARAAELNFDKFGRATIFEADDLKEIVGVGPFLERKLHVLGIYTFRQIAQFDKEDMAQVNDIIEFFPGRIERDDWVGQAHTLHRQKYGSSV